MVQSDARERKTSSHISYISGEQPKLKVKDSAKPRRSIDVDEFEARRGTLHKGCWSRPHEACDLRQPNAHALVDQATQQDRSSPANDSAGKSPRPAAIAIDPAYRSKSEIWHAETRVRARGAWEFSADTLVAVADDSFGALALAATAERREDRANQSALVFPSDGQPCQFAKREQAPLADEDKGEKLRRVETRHRGESIWNDRRLKLRTI
ncbi:uncharacterized protein LAESUDRAFT_748172 [Laetiporus sulphureus 93-53]|uniref:Uncharacterized protein n=1 Tax=Laetiporus sulphureus 93-53 TaxID=1314785 RepID=A0A165FXQ1_9APHY|nr:uncharacterized protein LAESUDRAFT_748172 [Laetiporus sulphureus 93-53]KZT09553.1 hypothetical protein LAESUDRAFT_748172 [Laetiporus sulphureus 93-53]